MSQVTKRLTSLVDAILKLTDIESRGYALADAPLPLEQLIATIIALCHDRAEQKLLTLTYELDALPKNLRGDASALETAVLCYLNNAITFTNAGSVTLRVRLLEEQSDSTLLRFEVQDTGIGIAPEAIPRLFALFEQVDNSPTRQYGGMGIGLVTVKRIARSLGGDIGCESTPGVGSLFWFSVRLKKSVPAFYT